MQYVHVSSAEAERHDVINNNKTNTPDIGFNKIQSVEQIRFQPTRIIPLLRCDILTTIYQKTPFRSRKANTKLTLRKKSRFISKIN